MFRLDRFEQVPLETLQTPENGTTVIKDNYWVVLNGHALLFKNGRHRAPQCNSNETITKMLIPRLYPEAESVFIPLAFVKEV